MNRGWLCWRTELSLRVRRAPIVHMELPCRLFQKSNFAGSPAGEQLGSCCKTWLRARPTHRRRTAAFTDYGAATTRPFKNFGHSLGWTEANPMDA